MLVKYGNAADAHTYQQPIASSWYHAAHTGTTSSNTVPVDAAQEMEVQAAASDTTLHTLAPSNTDAVQELQIVTSPEAVTSALVTPAAVTSAVRSHLVLFLQFFPKH